MNVIRLAKEVISIEIDALHEMEGKIGDAFERTIEIVLSTTGRLVVVGMGKSGIIGKKIVATLASTGTPSFFVHPGEAFHGDLGMIQPDDAVLMISNSGETEELIRLLPFMQFQKNKVIAMTGNLESTLAKNADVTLDISVAREACNNNLAPTSSTTATLVMGDALAVVLSTVRNFQPEDFARFHPGGRLGRRLLTRVRDVMQKSNLPICSPDTALRDVVSIITQRQLGIVLVMSDTSMLGIITDGDLRKVLQTVENPMSMDAKDFMTTNPHVVSQDARLAEAETLMQSLKKRMLVAVDSNQSPVGILQVFDI
ncbi:MAG: KpsF/GutQ family sugar-phosphate isomerase [Comamonadaceae bacterium PBBC2]|nr:MAG: KpsF/GutQ family sugar-phosphate isomerase [Comamonadaceae bacterium PBBC2]